MKKYALMMLLSVLASQAQAAAVGGMFAQGRSQVSLVAGSATAFEKNYLLVGASGSYYVLDGLGVGLAVESWSGNDPAMSKVSPFAQYVFLRDAPVQPYVGGFYRRTIISGLPSLNSVGGRGGIYINSSSNSTIGVGLVHESFLNCDEVVYQSCSSTYSDISLTFFF